MSEVMSACKKIVFFIFYSVVMIIGTQEGNHGRNENTFPLEKNSSYGNTSISTSTEDKFHSMLTKMNSRESRRALSFISMNKDTTAFSGTSSEKGLSNDAINMNNPLRMNFAHGEDTF